MNANAVDRHLQFVDEQLRATCARISQVVDLAKVRASRDDVMRALASCAAHEAKLEDLADPHHWPLHRLALSASEQRLLWVLIAYDLCPVARTQLRALSTESDVDVNLDVLRRVVYGSVPGPQARYELSSGGALRRLQLIVPLGPDSVPAHRMTFRIAERILALVDGVVAIDHELLPLLAAERDPVRRLDELFVAPEVRERVNGQIRKGAPITVVSGLVGSGRRSLIVAALHEAGHEPLTIDARRIAVERAPAERQLRIIERECRLLERVPVFTNIEALGASEGIIDRLDLVESELHRPVFGTAAKVVQRRWRRPPVFAEIPALTGAERAALWLGVMPGATEGDANLLATIYPLAPALVHAVSRAAVAESRGGPLDASHVTAGTRIVLDDRLGGLATRVTVKQSWNDLVLPEDQTMAIVELLARIRARTRVYEEWGFHDKLGKGLGVTALFSGPPGTGKTMCAGLIAKDLGTELFQVDLGKIVSKWIGETEKNLSALFDAAEASHAVLLFDEADSLFGKRTSVTSSNDRYANQETNFLLQRIESFAGICILTTNHETAIDEAFRRRLSLHVRFPLPDEDEREKLWRAMLPEKAPVAEELDLSALARKYVMGGGNIRNAVLRAAFLAADADEAIGNYHLRHAAQLEYESMGKLATNRD